MIKERLAALRAEMDQRGISIYVVPTADFHESEYVGEYFKARKFITGFTGSAGTAVITMDHAGLWTDGRYFVQAAAQLEGSGVTLYKMGNEGVPTIHDFIKANLKEGQTLGFDGRCLNAREAGAFRRIVSENKANISFDLDLIDLIWKDRPVMSHEKAWLVEEKFSGQSTADKLAAIRACMQEKGAEIHLISSLCDIAWILNIRGNDISYCPVVLSYLAITTGETLWFVQEEALTAEVRAYMGQNGVQICAYNDFYTYVADIPEGSKVLMDLNSINYRTLCNLRSGVKVIDEMMPSTRLKCIKNEVEMANARIAHEKDAVAMIEFIYWLKKNVGKIPMTEISAADHLEELRRSQPGCLDLSFSTIAGFAEHGAIVHYGATPETDAVIEPRSFLLVDSGGHYQEGTTDITRTIALGQVSQEMKDDFTLVLRSHLALANARFKKGCTGQNLDMYARAPFWQKGLDFNHGTGHGVGNVLNVHEGPQSIRWRSRGRNEEAIFTEGMITSDEPGIYLEGKYGIRTESEILCREGVKNEYGQFMYFENLTYVPIDLDAVDPAQMTAQEKTWLNEYHAFVYEKMAGHFDGEILAWLKESTRAI